MPLSGARLSLPIQHLTTSLWYDSFIFLMHTQCMHFGGVDCHHFLSLKWTSWPIPDVVTGAGYGLNSQVEQAPWRREACALVLRLEGVSLELLGRSPERICKSESNTAGLRNGQAPSPGDSVFEATDSASLYYY